jgi:S1-C subfamily serine protease
MAGVVALALVVAFGIGFLVRFRSGSDSDGSDATPVIGLRVDDMAKATVHIVGLADDGSALCSGSGTLVDPSGMVLTNAHVVTSDTVCNFSSLGVAVTTDSGRPPELLYEADVLVVDTQVDLAVIRIARSRDPASPLPDSFPYLALGDSDEVMIGDDIRVLGYPEIGGETITFTNGSVSGFTAQAGIGDRALIKTDATIAGGNSGGAAVNADGELIGIPTKARASESGPAVDCRPLADTNGDGAVNESDNCVPIGGFLNGIRPINLAHSLIEEASRATPQPIEQDTSVEVDLASVVVTNPRFSMGETDNVPREVVLTATAGIPELCLFVDWANIPDGAVWDGLWYRDQEVVEEYSLVKQTWKFGPEGSNFWMCAIDEQNGLPAGLYELGFFLSGKLLFAEGVVLTDAPVDVVTTSWQNITEVDVCGLAVNPNGSGPVGLDELQPGTVIGPGETFELDLPEGQVVVEAYDCNGNAIADTADTVLDIDSDTTYTISVPGG